jgi:hypothetical protein
LIGTSTLQDICIWVLILLNLFCLVSLFLHFLESIVVVWQCEFKWHCLSSLD